MSRAILHGHTVKPYVMKDDKRGIPTVSFTLKDEYSADWFPCFAVGAIARALVNKTKPEEPLIMICDIVSTPDTMLPGINSRVAFRVMSFQRG